MQNKLIIIVLAVLILSPIASYNCSAEEVVLEDNGFIAKNDTNVYSRFIEHSGDLIITFTTDEILTISVASGEQISRWLYHNGLEPEWLIQEMVVGSYTKTLSISHGNYEFAITNSEDILIQYYLRVTLKVSSAALNPLYIVGMIAISLLSLGILYYLYIYLKYRAINKKLTKK
ncbi:MAG: hypothetical protein ACTSYD_13875 [Candidatus Heimdallarchaeaceae archaeon]